MVSLSLGITISISRRSSSTSVSSDTPNPQPSSQSQAQLQHTPPHTITNPKEYTRSRTSSLCPSYTATYKSPSHTSTRPESLEHLLLHKTSTGTETRKRISIIQLENGPLRRRVFDMDGHVHEHEHHEQERKKSYGIGGAGNIRRPSDVIYPVRTNADGTRRRSSVWSSITTPLGTSPESGKKGFWGLFRRGSEGGVRDDGDGEVEVDAVKG